jgi:hypothetical protein
VSTATSYGMDEQGVGDSEIESLYRVKNFLFSKSSRPALGPSQPLVQCITGAVSPGVKRPGREADDSPSASGSIHPLPHTHSPRIS